MKDYFYYKDNQNERKKEDDKKIIKANLVIQKVGNEKRI